MTPETLPPAGARWCGRASRIRTGGTWTVATCRTGCVLSVRFAADEIVNDGAVSPSPLIGTVTAVNDTAKHHARVAVRAHKPGDGRTLRLPSVTDAWHSNPIWAFAQTVANRHLTHPVGRPVTGIGCGRVIRVSEHASMRTTCDVAVGGSASGTRDGRALKSGDALSRCRRLA